MKIIHGLIMLLLAFSLAAAPAQKPTPPKTSSTSAPGSKLLDINSATQMQLEELPGIGPTYAGRIIKGRPYRSKNELLNKKVIPESTYNKIKDLIVARQKK